MTELQTNGNDDWAVRRIEVCDCSQRFPVPSNATKLLCPSCGEIWYTQL
ncbi:MAG: hypothetical protein ACFFDT_15685 [Candidatus Hodarchaeota archaeon]